MASVVISGDTSGSVTLSAPAVAGTTTLTLPATSGTILQSGTVVTEAQGGNGTTTGYYGFKNRIINGAMVIDQRNAGASVTPTNGQYTLDRFAISIGGGETGKLSIQQNAGSVTPPTGFTNYLGVTSLSAYTVPTANWFSLLHQVEGFNVADLAWGTASAATITLSFWVRSSLTGTFGGALNNSGNARNYPYSYTINAANTWEQKSITIAGDTSGTWNKTNSNGIQVGFALGAGTTESGTAGAWTATRAFSATGATSVVGTNGATFYITGVQLEKGSTATSFDYRPYGTELGLCQRYFISIGSGAIGANNSGGNLMVLYAMPVNMRVVPSVIQSGTITVYGPSFADYNTSAPVSASGSSVRQSVIEFTGASGGGAGIASRTYGTGVLLFNSEL
jgi:hypothetical protein